MRAASHLAFYFQFNIYLTSQRHHGTDTEFGQYQKCDLNPFHHTHLPQKTRE